jgi:2Fe-2S ferredoxin
MNVERKEIIITLKNAGEQYVVKTYPNEYRNLMSLLNNSIYLENFGECGGQGRCATCIVKVSGLKGSAGTMERNEKTTINKTGLSDSNFRLSCQLLITEDLHEAVIEIYEEGY